MEDWKLPESIVGAGRRYGGRMKGAKNRAKVPGVEKKNECENTKRYKRDREKCRNENLTRAFSALRSILGCEDINLSRVDILTQAKSRIEELDNLLNTDKNSEQDNLINMSMLTSEKFWEYLFADEEDFELN